MTSSLSQIFTERDVWDGEEVDNNNHINSVSNIADNVSVESNNMALTHETNTNTNAVSRHTSTQNIQCLQWTKAACNVSPKIKTINNTLNEIAHRVETACRRIGLSEADIVDKWNEFTENTLITFLQHYAEDIEAEEEKWAQENELNFRKLVALCTYLHELPHEEQLQQLITKCNNTTDMQVEQREAENKVLPLINTKLDNFVMQTYAATQNQTCIMETSSFVSHIQMKTIITEEYTHYTSVAHKRFATLLLLHRLHQIVQHHTEEFMQMSNKNDSLTHCHNSCNKQKSDKKATFYQFDIVELFTKCFMLYKLDLEHYNNNNNNSSSKIDNNTDVVALQQNDVTASSLQSEECSVNDATVLEYDKNDCNCEETATPSPNSHNEVNNANEGEEEQLTKINSSLLENEENNSVRSSIQYASALSSRASSCLIDSANFTNGTTDNVNNKGKQTYKTHTKIKNDVEANKLNKQKCNIDNSNNNDDNNEDEDEQLQLLLMASAVEDELNDPRGMSYCLQPRQTLLSSESVNQKHKFDNCNSSNTCNNNTSMNNNTTNITCTDDDNTREGQNAMEVKAQNNGNVNEQNNCKEHHDKTNSNGKLTANAKENMLSSTETDSSSTEIVWQQNETIVSLIKPIDASTIINKKLEQNLSIERLNTMTQYVHDALEQYNSVLQHASSAQLVYIRTLIEKCFIEELGNDNTGENVGQKAQNILTQTTDARCLCTLTDETDNPQMEIIATTITKEMTEEANETNNVNDKERNCATTKDCSNTVKECTEIVSGNNDITENINKEENKSSTVQEEMWLSMEHVMQIIQQHILELQNSTVKSNHVHKAKDDQINDNSSCKSDISKLYKYSKGNINISSGDCKQIIYDIIAECDQNMESKREERARLCEEDEKVFNELPEGVQSLFTYRLHCREWQFLVHITHKLENYLIMRYRDKIHNLHNKLNEVYEEEYLLTGIRYNYCKNEHFYVSEYNKKNIQENDHNHQPTHLENEQVASVETSTHICKCISNNNNNGTNNSSCGGDVSKGAIDVKSDLHSVSKANQVNEMQVNVHRSSSLIHVEEEIMYLQRAWSLCQHKLVVLRNAHELVQRRSKLLAEEEELRVHSRDRLLSKKINMAKQLLYEESVRRRVRRELPSIHAELVKLVQEWHNMFVSKIDNDRNKLSKDKTIFQQKLYIHGVDVEELVNDLVSKSSNTTTNSGNNKNNSSMYKLSSRSRERCDDGMSIVNNENNAKLITLNTTNNSSKSCNSKITKLESATTKCNFVTECEEEHSTYKTKPAITRSATPCRGNKLQPLSYNNNNTINNSNIVQSTSQAKNVYSKQITRSATPTLHASSSSSSSLKARRWNTSVHEYLPHTLPSSGTNNITPWRNKSNSNNNNNNNAFHTRNWEKENVINKWTPAHVQMTSKPLSMPSRSTSVSSTQSHLSNWPNNISTPVSRANRMKYFVPTRRANVQSASKQTNNNAANNNIAMCARVKSNSISTFSKPTLSSATKNWSKTQISESAASVDNDSGSNKENKDNSRSAKDKDKYNNSAIKHSALQTSAKTNSTYLHKRQREDETLTLATTLTTTSVNKTPVTDRCLQTELSKDAQEFNVIKSAEMIANASTTTSNAVATKSHLQNSTVEKGKRQKLENSYSPAPRTPSHAEQT